MVAVTVVMVMTVVVVVVEGVVVVGVLVVEAVRGKGDVGGEGEAIGVVGMFVML